VTDFSRLPPLDRAKRYRQLAEDARREANAAQDDARQSYRVIADQWDRLADDIEKRTRQGDKT
jgi:hypothetical protein